MRRLLLQWFAYLPDLGSVHFVFLCVDWVIRCWCLHTFPDWIFVKCTFIRVCLIISYYFWVSWLFSIHFVLARSWRLLRLFNCTFHKIWYDGCWNFIYLGIQPRWVFFAHVYSSFIFWARIESMLPCIERNEISRLLILIHAEYSWMISVCNRCW